MSSESLTSSSRDLLRRVNIEELDGLLVASDAQRAALRTQAHLKYLLIEIEAIRLVSGCWHAIVWWRA